MDFEQYEFDPQVSTVPVQSSSPLQNLGAALAPAAGSTGLQILGQIGMEAISQRSYRKNQKQLYELGQKAQVNAARNMVEGMKKAGLSPASISGQPQAAAVSSAPKSTANAAAPQAMPEMNLLNAQAALLQSEKELNESKKTGQDIQNENMEGANLTYNDAYDKVLALFEMDAAGDPTTQAIVNALRANGRLIHNEGDYNAMIAVISSLRTQPEVVADRLAKFFESNVSRIQLENPNIAAGKAIVPLLENSETRARVAQLVALAGELRTQSQVNESMVGKMKREIDWLGSEIARNYAQSEEYRAQMNAIQNSDVQTLIKNGDWKGVAANAVEGAVKRAYEGGIEVAKMYAGGAAYGKAVVAGKAAQVGKSAAAPAPAPAPAPASKTRASASRSSSPLADKIDYANFNASLRSMMKPGRVFTTIDGHPYYKDPNDKNWHRAGRNNGFPIYK